MPTGLPRPSGSSPGKSPKKWKNVINWTNPSAQDFDNITSD